MTKIKHHFVIKNQVRLMLAFFLVLISNPVFSEEEKEKSIDISELTQQQRASMGITTTLVRQKPLTEQLMAPGEVRMNAYLSSQVTSRISAQIIQRHVQMGDKVTTGQKLVTLSSVEMAEAQGQLFIADREWQRVRKLGRKVVSEQRYIKTQVTRQQAYAKVLAYGMTESQANHLLLKNNASKATGTFDLLSVQDGSIISDNFIIGQVVEPGQLLMEVSDESIVWVEAKINPEDMTLVKIGSKTDIYLENNIVLKAKVIQLHHRLDEVTRTLSVRIEVKNQQGLLHSGQFVKAGLEISTGTAVLAIPKSSVILLQGHTVVFQLLNNKLQTTLVEQGETRGDWVEIKAGLKAGDSVVNKGMFLLKSLLLKSQIGDAD